MAAPLLLPGQRWLEATAGALLQPPGGPAVDFTRPAGEAALAGPDSVAWQVFRNPVALFAGGVAAVILELAEPRVRAGVWRHSSFRADPALRLQRTGLAAMVTVYAARSVAERMIAGITRQHAAVRGTTPDGERYDALDPVLLDWVQATAAFGFGEAFHRYVQPLTPAARDRFYAEGLPAARLYGASGAPGDAAAMAALFDAMRPRLAPSPELTEFLALMRRTPILPGPLRAAQPMLVRAAVSAVPHAIRRQLELQDRGLRAWEAPLVRRAGALAQRVLLRTHPAVQACRRLGLPEHHLHRACLVSSAPA